MRTFINRPISKQRFILNSLLEKFSFKQDFNGTCTESDLIFAEVSLTFIVFNLLLL